MTEKKEVYRSKRYTFTWNNYNDEDIIVCKSFFEEFCVYGIYAKEVGEGGTAHLQGYFETKNKITITGLKKKFTPKAHLSVALGTAEENHSYCVGPYKSKDGKKTKPLNPDHYIYGSPMVQGKRSDLDAVRAILAEGPSHTLERVIDSGASYQGIRYAEKVLTYKERKRNWIPQVIWLYGETGVGKTETAYKLAAIMGEDPHTKVATKGDQWWDGYDAHAFVIIDEFRTDWMPYNVLLALLDSKPFRLQIKGGHRQLLARTIVITCPQAPSELIFPFEADEEKKQLRRRISKTIQITGENTPEEYAYSIHSKLLEEKDAAEEEEALMTCASDGEKPIIEDSESSTEEDCETDSEELRQKTRLFREFQRNNKKASLRSQ